MGMKIKVVAYQKLLSPHLFGEPEEKHLRKSLLQVNIQTRDLPNTKQLLNCDFKFRSSIITQGFFNLAQSV
jgi:hypothetical protein